MAERQTAASAGAAGFESTKEILRAGKDQAVDEARAMVRDIAEEQKARAAQGLGGVAQALHQAARSLSGDKQGLTARYTDLAAEQIERASQVLHERSWNDLLSDAEDFARRQPALFVGGAAAAGFLLARFIKSSGQTTMQRDFTATSPIPNAYSAAHEAGGTP